MDRIKQAENNFRNGCNCCQAVFLAYADKFNISEKQALMLTSTFGAGIGKIRETCGVITAMAMITGLADGYSDLHDNEAKQNTYGEMQSMIADFTKVHNTVVCRELLGLQKGEDLAEPAIRDEEYYQSRPCLSLVKTSCEIIEKYIK